jgi:high-affinity iron transporter
VLTTFVIGLREGVEASLIVGIIAAFVGSHGRRDALRYVWLGVGLACALCLAIGTALQVIAGELNQRQQESLETIVAIVAVGMVTYMILWMRRNARGMKRHLESAAASALARGTAMALVAMAVLAVFREGFETAVFMLAAFNASGNAVAAGLGAVLGVATASVIGYGIYRGGVRLNLNRFFRLTGIVLVFVAAGLVATALHTAHEAGWINFGQTQVADLTWIAAPGSVSAALLTGVLGIQPEPVVIEVVGYFLYLIPMLTVVLWPTPRQVRPTAPVPAAETAGVATPRP